MGNAVDCYLFWCEHGPDYHKYDCYLTVPVGDTSKDAEATRKHEALPSFLAAEKRAKATAAVKVQYVGFCKAMGAV